MGGGDPAKPLRNVKLRPVSGSSAENKSFYAWTPTGEFNFQFLNHDAASHFKVGSEYYVDISPA